MTKRRALILVLLLVCVAASCADKQTQMNLPSGSPTPKPRPLPPLWKSSKDVRPGWQVGQQVFLTTKGFKPKQLTATVGEELAFYNETDDVATIVLDGDAFTATLAPHGCAVYVPRNASAIGYHLAGKPSNDGFVQVEAFFEPGEDPAAEERLDADASPNRFPSCSHPRS